MESTPRAIIWEAPEHYYQEKGGDWYFSLAVITIAVVVAALMFGNILFALLLALSGFALGIIGAKRPSIVPFAVTVRGVDSIRMIVSWGCVQFNGYLVVSVANE